MALTNELLRANTTLAGLTDEQVSAIVEMSQNDERTVIGQKTGEIYGGLDADILSASGIAKNGVEKTYEYAKRVIGEIKAQAGDAAAKQTQIDELTKEKVRLEGIIAKGGADAETKRQLEQARADLANVTKEYGELKTLHDQTVAKHEKELFDQQISGEFAKVSVGLKFKADIPASATSVLTEQAIAKVKGMNPQYIDDGNGGKVLAFMENGTPRRNPDNNLRPYTAAELVAKELRTMGVLDEGRTQTGTGAREGDGTGNPPSSSDISGARTQSEAQEIITKQLLSRGLINGSKEFTDELTKAWKENYDYIKGLPIQ